MAEMIALASKVQSLGVYLGRVLQPLDELMQHRGDSVGSYASALQEAGATHGNYWAIAGVEGGLMGLTLVWAGDEEEGTLSLACHLVPVSWVSERFVKKEVRGIDVRWSWADVIELDRARIGADASDAEGNLPSVAAARTWRRQLSRQFDREAP